MAKKEIKKEVKEVEKFGEKIDSTDSKGENVISKTINVKE